LLDGRAWACSTLTDETGVGGVVSFYNAEADEYAVRTEVPVGKPLVLHGEQTGKVRVVAALDETSFRDTIEVMVVQLTAPSQCYVFFEETAFPDADVIVYPEEGLPAAWTDLVWTSLDPAQLSVTEKGIAFIHAGGDRCADIRVSLKNQPMVADTIQLILRDELQALKILPPALTLETGLQTYPFRVEAEPAYASVLPVKWSVSDESIAGIDDATGFVIAHKPGNVMIRVQSLSVPTVTDSLEVRVISSTVLPEVPVADSIAFSGKSNVMSPPVKEIKVGETLELTAFVWPKAETTPYELSWSLSMVPDLIAEWESLPGEHDRTVRIKGLSIGWVRIEALTQDGSALKALLEVEVVHSQTTAVEPLPSSIASSVVYGDGELALSGLSGSRVSVFSLTGRVLAVFAVEDDVFRSPLTLPAGVYVLRAEKQGLRTAVKFKACQ
jgi:hypothetical protein